ncbi:DUF2218 domain-containing protein [Arsenicicoccus piscis]|uniref:DUF2218 domain-containing protein n=1 Tax=Arsenicicoccus piscis TaxID=673954 RepID=A0ABQ6HR48_9MICO|nr:DUF2218 domain-containing protein [Arsenicicoccus piscis]MCH8626330.1 DUF2218 domain-containing protein [Arsenicicoccus piscis]GMA20936.1 hypothetical protein GCM10025862_29570 [Arsenicicoccus piscis]
MTVTGRMATERPERYAKQLASHWSAKGTSTTLDDGAVRIELASGGTTVLRPVDGALLVEANSPEFGAVVERHLQRFGQREELVVVWDEPASEASDGDQQT